METSRRSFLRYVGFGAGALALGPLARGNEVSRRAGGWVTSEGSPGWGVVPYPVPLPGDEGDGVSDAARLARYEVRDALRLPEGFTYDVIATWGDKFGPAGREFVFGHNADYTGLAPMAGAAAGEYWLIVNHEFISGRPWLQRYMMERGAVDIRMSTEEPEKYLEGRLVMEGVVFEGPNVDIEKWLGAKEAAGLSDEERIGRLVERSKLPRELFENMRDISRAALADMGLSVLHVRRRSDGGFEVVRDSAKHLRFTGAVKGVRQKIEVSGPAARLIGSPGGTMNNCSGATTPWGTFLSCEENYQDYVADGVTEDGAQLETARCGFGGQIGNGEHPLPFEMAGLGQGAMMDVDPRGYGWVCEVDPVGRVLTKHTALGRFRHENVAIRAEAGKRLAAYMGDDRRGGHVWKFVSDGVVGSPTDGRNAELLGKGTLYVARIEKEGFRGRWVPLVPETKLVRPEPGRTAMGHIQVPWRPGGGRISVGLPSSRFTEISLSRWVSAIEAYVGKKFEECTLGNLVKGDDPLGVLMLDAFAFANVVGGTPCSRPEDVEVHPRDRSVYVAFTDSTGSVDGSPDVRIFPDSAGKNSRQYGTIYRIVEDGDDPAATTFGWGKFVSSGEAHEGGGGFACADNLMFDPAGNLWMVCDITTPSHNLPVTRDEADKSNPGSKAFPGIFGNNAMFMIPTGGKDAGRPFCFAIGPMECELTGPTFSEDGRALILAVQHPGELYGTRGHWASSVAMTVTREMKIAGRDGRVFTQVRRVPLGSNFPSGRRGEVPRSCVVCIRRG